MEPAGEDEGEDDNDELFVRPVVRIAAPVPVDIAVSSAEISGKRQRSQVIIFGSSFNCRRPALERLAFSPALIGVHGGTPKFLGTFGKNWVSNVCCFCSSYLVLSEFSPVRFQQALGVACKPRSIEKVRTLQQDSINFFPTASLV